MWWMPSPNFTGGCHIAALSTIRLFSFVIFLIHAGICSTRWLDNVRWSYSYRDRTVCEFNRLKLIFRLQLGVDHIVSHDLTNRAEQIRTGLLWSDPMASVETWEKSRRGAGVHFGQHMVDKFLYLNNLDVRESISFVLTRQLIVRSHEVAEEGFEKLLGGKVYVTDVPSSNAFQCNSFLSFLLWWQEHE